MTAQKKDQVFGYIVATAKKAVKGGSAFHYGFLVAPVGQKADKAEWYNAYAGTIKSEKFFDAFHKGQLVGLNLTDDQNFKNIANIHNASKKPVAKEA